MSDRASDLSAASSLIKSVLSPMTQNIPRNCAADWMADAVPTAAAGAKLGGNEPVDEARECW